MDDELAPVRLRGTRISISFLIASTSFAALAVIIVGLLSTARAEETQQPKTIEQLADSGTAPVAAPAASTSAVSAMPPRRAKEADEQITRGLTMVLLALTGVSALGVWRRRTKGQMIARAR